MLTVFSVDYCRTKTWTLYLEKDKMFGLAEPTIYYGLLKSEATWVQSPLSQPLDDDQAWILPQ